MKFMNHVRELSLDIKEGARGVAEFGNAAATNLKPEAKKVAKEIKAGFDKGVRIFKGALDGALNAVKSRGK